MLTNSLRLMTVAALLTLTACSHGTMRGSVAMKTAENQAHVCLGEGEVKAGDRVALFRNACTPKGGRGADGGGGGCQKTRIGEGKVLENLNEHYSLVQFDEGVKFEEGTFVEKL